LTMFRTAILPVSRLATSQSRSFVSSVLLTKTWENESVLSLRKEAKNRGVSSTGNKANLILRLQGHDKASALQAMTPPVQVGARSASTATGTSPGVPAAAQPNVPDHKLSTNTNIPDISQSDPEVEVEVPFVPDFWDSKEVKAAQEAAKIKESPLPKISLVAGAETHPAGGPSHNLHDEHAQQGTIMDSHIVPPSTGTSFWGSLVGSLGAESTIQNAAAGAQSAVLDVLPQAGGIQQRTEKRNLTPEERKGVWMLVGIVLGGWTLGGIVN